MPIEMRKEPDAGVVAVNLTGEISFGEIRAFVESLFADAGMRGRDMLWDLRAGTIATITTEELGEINAFAESRLAAGELPPVRVAVVAPRDVDFGISRMQQTLSSKLGVEVRVFRGLSEAERWLAG